MKRVSPEIRAKIKQLEKAYKMSHNLTIDIINFCKSSGITDLSGVKENLSVLQEEGDLNYKEFIQYLEDELEYISD